MTCRDCGIEVEVWGCVQLCDRCIDAMLYRQLKEDDFVLLRKQASGRITLASGRGGSRWTDLTALRLDPESETLEAVRELLGAAQP